MSALAELDALRAEVVEHEQRVAAAITAARVADAEPSRLEAQIRRYHEDVGAGRRAPDPALAARLQSNLARARSEMTTRTVGAGGSYEINAVTDALATGARSALEEARQQVTKFLFQRRDDLAAELAANARELAERYAPVAAEVAELEREMAAVRRQWSPIVEALRIPGDMAESPARRGRFADRPMPPMPLALLQEEEVNPGAMSAWKNATSPTAQRS